VRDKYIRHFRLKFLFKISRCENFIFQKDGLFEAYFSHEEIEIIKIMIKVKLLDSFKAVWEFIELNIFPILFVPKVSNSFPAKKGNFELFPNSRLISLATAGLSLPKKVCPVGRGIISLLKFILYAKRDNNKFFHHTNACCYHGRWEFSRFFC
jgi:hypothetical protein